MTVAVRPGSSCTPGGNGSRWMRTGMRCASRTQLKVGLMLASRFSLALRSRSSIAAGDALDPAGERRLAAEEPDRRLVAGGDRAELGLLEIAVDMDGIRVHQRGHRHGPVVT